MSEQLSKDTARMHRLELDNQRLKSDIEDLKHHVGIGQHSSNGPTIAIKKFESCSRPLVTVLKTFLLSK